MPTKLSSPSASAGKQYYLITNVGTTTTSKADSEIDLHAESWKLPYSIDDSDLTFDGKPLNMLHEENRWVAERSNSDVCVFLFFVEGDEERQLNRR